MMDNEQESMAASAIKSLAMGTRDLPPPQNLERLPQMEIHSSSGFSQLNDNTKSDKNEPQNVNESFPAEKGSETPPAKQQNGSILASVLERTRKDDVQENAIGQENSVSSEQAPVAKVPSTPSRPLTNLSQLPDNFLLSRRTQEWRITRFQDYFLAGSVSFPRPDAFVNGRSRWWQFERLQRNVSF